MYIHLLAQQKVLKTFTEKSQDELKTTFLENRLFQTRKLKG